MSSAQTPSASTEPQAPRRRGWRVAALGLIGVLAVLLPLSQVLRFQVEDLIENRQERARLDPLAEAVNLQLGLMGHDKVATRVLKGRTTLEGERLLRQAEVDRQVARLKATLWAGSWQGAHREAAALQTEWNQLVVQVSQRRIDAAQSQDSHRLLLEQVVQVMDLVQAGLMLPLGSDTAERLLARVDSRQAELQQRIERAESGLWALAAATLALLAWGVVVARALTFGGAKPPMPPNATPRASLSDTRRGHGRRSGDQAAQAAPHDVASAGIEAARRGFQHETS